MPPNDASSGGSGGSEQPMAQAERKRRRTRRAESRIPTFTTVQEAADFWDTHSTTEFEDEFEEAPDVQFVVTRHFAVDS